MTANFKMFLYWGIGSLALIALAAYLPKAAIIFTIILVAGVLLTHWKDYTSLLSPPVSKNTPAKK